MSSPTITHSGRRASRIKLTDATPAVLRFKDGRNTSGRLQVVSVTGGLLSLQRAVHQGSTAKLMFLTRKGAVLGAAEMLPPVSSTLQPFRFIALDRENHRRLHQTVQAELGEAGERTGRTAAPGGTQISRGASGQYDTRGPSFSDTPVMGSRLAQVSPGMATESSASAAGTVSATRSDAGSTSATNQAVPEEAWIRKYRAAVTDGAKPEKKLTKMLFGVFTLGAALFGAKYFFHSNR